jgi:putative hydrolase of the HAD superfamily
MDAIILDLDDTLIVEQAAARRAIADALADAPGSSSTGPADNAGDDTGGKDDAVVDTAIGCARKHWHSSEYFETCRRLGIASWEGLWATFAGCHHSLDGLAEWAPEYRRRAWEDTLLTLGADPDLSREVSDRYIDAQRQGHPPIPSALEAARIATGTMPVGVLTNGPPDIQWLKLRQIGLDLGDTVVISAEVGIGKPDPGAFALALDRLGTRAQDTVMIGDSWERDILGSIRVGMRAVWISSGRQMPDQIDRVIAVDRLTPGTFDLL